MQSYGWINRKQLVKVACDRNSCNISVNWLIDNGLLQSTLSLYNIFIQHLINQTNALWLLTIACEHCFISTLFSKSELSQVLRGWVGSSHGYQVLSTVWREAGLRVLAIVKLNNYWMIAFWCFVLTIFVKLNPRLSSLCINHNVVWQGVNAS